MFNEGQTNSVDLKNPEMSEKEDMYEAFGLFRELPIDKFKGVKGENGGELKQNVMNHPEWSNDKCALVAKLAMILNEYEKNLPHFEDKEKGVFFHIYGNPDSWIGTKNILDLTSFNFEEKSAVQADIVKKYQFDITGKYSDPEIFNNFVEPEALKKWFMDFLDMKDLEITRKHYLDNNNNKHEGKTVVFEAKTFIKNNEDLKNVANLCKLFPIVIEEVIESCYKKQRNLEVVITGDRFANMTEENIDDSIQITEIINNIIFNKVTEYIKSNYRDRGETSFNLQLDVNDNEITPIIVEKTPDHGIFGHGDYKTRLIKLNKIRLINKLKSLNIDKIDFSYKKEKYNLDAGPKNIHLNFPEPLKCNLRLFTFRSDTIFLVKLEDWIDKHFGKSGQEESKNTNEKNIIKDEDYYLNELGLNNNEFDKFNNEEKIKEVKSIYKKLTREYHPDLYRSKNPASVKTAEGLMKELNEAYGYFREKYHF